MEVFPMLRRFERVVADVRDHATVARELSRGLLDALGVLVGHSATVDDVLQRHDRLVRAELPGF
jgi:hypothetical protein